MSSEPDAGAPDWPRTASEHAVTAQPERGLTDPDRPGRQLWAADLPDDHPSYPDPSNAWTPGRTPRAVRGLPYPTPRTRPGPARHAEQDLHDRLERLGQLTGSVAHDVNNLLAVIRNYAAFVAEALDPTADEDGVSHDWEAIRWDVTQLRRAADRAAGLTAELLSEACQPPPEVEAADVNSVVSETLAMLRRPLGVRTELRVELDDALWRVRADPVRLERAIVNLAMNARDAMPRGGTLTVMTGNVILGGRPDAAVAAYGAGKLGVGKGTRPVGVVEPAAPVGWAGPAGRPGAAGGATTPRHYVCVWVSDTGAGMSPVTRARAFEPFFTTKPTGQGTGLGLAVVRDVVTEIGGDVQIFSTVGVGTTVSLLLPAVEPRAAQASTHEASVGQDRAGQDAGLRGSGQDTDVPAALGLAPRGLTSRGLTSGGLTSAGLAPRGLAAGGQASGGVAASTSARPRPAIRRL